MDPIILAFWGEGMADYTPRTLPPMFPLARELYQRDNHIPAEMEEAEHGE